MPLCTFDVHGFLSYNHQNKPVRIWKGKVRWLPVSLIRLGEADSLNGAEILVEQLQHLLRGCSDNSATNQFGDKHVPSEWQTFQPENCCRQVCNCLSPSQYLFVTESVSPSFYWCHRVGLSPTYPVTPESNNKLTHLHGSE